jgi:hypothetical protein
MRNRENISIFALSLLVITVSLSFIGSAQSSQIPWGNVSLISSSSFMDASNSDIAIDSQNNVNIVWMQEMTSNSVGEIFYTKLDRLGNVLVNNRQLTNFSGIDSFSPSISIDPFDNIHIVWEHDTFGPGLEGIRYLRLDQNGTIVVNGAYLNGAEYEEMATDSQGNIIMAFAGDNEIYYAKYDNQGNTLIPKTLVTNTSLAEPDFRSVSIAINSNDVTYITWAEELDGPGSTPDTYLIRYTSVASNGVVLTNNVQVNAGMNQSDHPSIAIDNSDNVIFSWNDYDPTINSSSIYISKIDSNSTVLINPKVVLANSVNGEISTNVLGAINLVTRLRQFIQLDPSANPITSPILIGVGSYFIPKIISDNQEGIHVVWTDSSISSNNEIYYQKSLNPATLELKGNPRPGQKIRFNLKDVYNPHGHYVLAISTSASQGITLADGRVIPLDDTPVLQASINNPTGIGLSNSMDKLRNGKGKVTLDIPNIPSLSGTTYYVSFITSDVNGQVFSISDPIEFTII